METIRIEDRSDNPTINEVLAMSQNDLLDVLASRFNGLTYPRLTLGSLSNLSPDQARLLSAVLLAMVARFQLQSLTETSDIEIGRQTLMSLHDWQIGYERVSHLLECMELVGAIDLTLDQSD